MIFDGGREYYPSVTLGKRDSSPDKGSLESSRTSEINLNLTKEYSMTDFGINEMQEMQKALQDKYQHKWEPICPEIGQNKLLWMLGEVGEVIDIVKKHGGTKASTDEDLRKDLVEEMADVLMYYNDVMLCYSITAEELKEAYTSKFEKNMKRW